jgi:hypothetical protein
METNPRMILKRRMRWLMATWIVCSFLPEIVLFLRWQFPKLKEFPMVALAAAVLVGVAQLTARLMSCPVCRRGLPKRALNLQSCPHCGTDYNQPMPHRLIS